MYINEELKPGIRSYLGKTVWTGFIQGLSALIFGVYAFFSPIGTLSFFLTVIGFLLIVHGAMMLLSSLMGIRSDSLWPLLCGSGIFQLLIGIFITSRAAGISTVAMMILTVGIGIVGIITGTISLISAIRYRDVITNVWSFIARGALLFIIGIAMLLAPFGFGTAMVRAVALIAVFLGILQCWGAVQLYRELSASEV